MKRKILVITGPTASGKSALAVSLAKLVGGEVISADSMQIYKEMDIGTAKPEISEMEGIPHHILDFLSPDKSFTVAEFQGLCAEKIEEITRRGKLPIIVGGTGLYINSILKPWSFSETPPSDEIREKIRIIHDEKGKEHLYNMLMQCDPESAEKIHPNNVKRVMRALEVYMSSGIKKSTLDMISQQGEIPYDPIVIGIKMDRGKLYERINRRVDMMMECGLVEEVRNLYEKGYDLDLQSMQGLGYKEIVRYLKKELSLDEAVEILKRDTRRFAKRQITWFKRLDDIKWIDPEDYADFESMVQEILELIKAEGYVDNVGI
ncbi:tRNA (adenosine(37)-N6)-dimethylallyltransferase MiaA [Alkalibacter mobilis]|uniref:tRNA (adenosine(37)-N6)-dimethylallyltransferase MiaA n=1 Tax=Alkalibacter mobilis TaxID=2787712 RepID=UPI0018A125EF|nr:tRNA (adenosine(37)-N6)-dimethylallyltransferase MiaA [Alkalibacter mobilis]MBF7097621.1 tRNA (adenosine(37)-N6)-dimethylallyltransferase MiaA [Alkalibacter mobilis]